MGAHECRVGNAAGADGTGPHGNCAEAQHALAFFFCAFSQSKGAATFCAAAFDGCDRRTWLSIFSSRPRQAEAIDTLKSQAYAPGLAKPYARPREGDSVQLGQDSGRVIVFVVCTRAAVSNCPPIMSIRTLQAANAFKPEQSCEAMQVFFRNVAVTSKRCQ